MKRQNIRRRFTRDNAWLRRARRHFSQLCRPWVERAKKPEEFRARLCVVAMRAIEGGFYAANSSERLVMFGILSNWKSHDRAKWWPWMHADKRRASVADWSIRTVDIKRAARRLLA